MNGENALISSLARVGNRKLLRLLAKAERAFGLGVIRARRTIHGTTFERLSPENYWPDGSQRCPFEEFLGHVACDYHSYSGCSNDPDDAEETARLRADALIARSEEGAL